jgi:hypothetical protein
MYGDFGRYVMQSAVGNFTEPAAANPDAESLFGRYPPEDAGVAKRLILQRIVELGWPDEKGDLARFERSIESNGRQRPPISARNGREVFFGSVGSSAVVTASYQEFMGWLGDRNWCLVWCVLSERSIQQVTELLAESHQSAVVVLRPFEKPVRILAKRSDWRKDEDVDFLQ